MVDYNATSTISTPPGDVLKLQIMERRHYCINAIEQYNKITQRGGSEEAIHVVKGSVYSLFLELEGSLRDSLSEQKVTVLNQKAISNDYGTLVQAFSEMNVFLYEKRLTKFDTRKDVDQTLVEAVNFEHGL